MADDDDDYDLEATPAPAVIELTGDDLNTAKIGIEWARGRISTILSWLEGLFILVGFGLYEYAQNQASGTFLFNQLEANEPAYYFFYVFLPGFAIVWLGVTLRHLGKIQQKSEEWVDVMVEERYFKKAGGTGGGYKSAIAKVRKGET